MRERRLVVASLIAFGLLFFLFVFHLTTNASTISAHTGMNQITEGPALGMSRGVSSSPPIEYYVYLPIIRNGKWWSISRYMTQTNWLWLYDLGRLDAIL